VAGCDGFTERGIRAAMKAPQEIVTERLALRRPVAGDAEAIFERYASDEAVCRYLAWPRHRNLGDTRQFLAFSDQEWARAPAGPYLVLAKDSGALIGSTGLAFETPYRASTGYVIVQSEWGRGYATEALFAMRSLAGDLGVQRLYAACHPDHLPSRRVLEKAGFSFEGTLRRFVEFPNLAHGVALDAVCYSFVGEN